MVFYRLGGGMTLFHSTDELARAWCHSYLSLKFTRATFLVCTAIPWPMELSEDCCRTHEIISKAQSKQGSFGFLPRVQACKIHTREECGFCHGKGEIWTTGILAGVTAAETRTDFCSSPTHPQQPNVALAMCVLTEVKDELVTSPSPPSLGLLPTFTQKKGLGHLQAAALLFPTGDLGADSVLTVNEQVLPGICQCSL